MTGMPAGWPGMESMAVETKQRLETLVGLLEKWNPTINLVAPASLKDVWQRHVADSAQIFSLCPAGARSWLDLGSGGGFPGLVVAALAMEVEPALSVELVEADQRKCVFLQTAARALDLDVKITRARIEKLPPRHADVISARALAPLDRLCGYALRHLAPGGVCLFLKGAGLDHEIAEARRHFDFDLTLSPSETDATGMVAKLTELRHV